MSITCGSQGSQTILCVTEHDVALDGNSERYDFVQEDLGLREWVVGVNDIFGTLDLSAAHRRIGPSFVVGRILMHVSPKELENWLPRIMHNSIATGTYVPGTTAKEFDVWIKRDDESYKYTGCQITSAMFSSNARLSDEPQLVSMMLTIIGETETDATWPGTIPAAPSADVLYWLHGDSSLTFDDSASPVPDIIDDTAWPFEAFNLLIDHGMRPLFRNSLSPICLRSEYRRIRMQLRLPLSDESSTQMYFNRLDCVAQLKFDGSTNLADATSDTQIDFSRLFNSKKTPVTRPRSETFLDLNLEAYYGASVTANPVIEITNAFPAP